MSFQSTRFFRLSLLIAAFAILFSAQTAPAQCLESPAVRTGWLSIGPIGGNKL